MLFKKNEDADKYISDFFPISDAHLSASIQETKSQPVWYFTPGKVALHTALSKISELTEL